MDSLTPFDYVVLYCAFAALVSLAVAFVKRKPKEYFPAGETEVEITEWVRTIREPRQRLAIKRFKKMQKQAYKKA